MKRRPLLPFVDFGGIIVIKHLNEQRFIINLKVTVKECDQLNAAARKYTDGNVSAWLRLAGLNFRPYAKSIWRVKKPVRKTCR